MLKIESLICLVIFQDGNWKVCALDERVRGAGRDAAVVVPVARHLDVAEVAPRAAPRVLHEPVVAALLVRAVAHHQHLDNNLHISRRHTTVNNNLTRLNNNIAIKEDVYTFMYLLFNMLIK